MNRRVFLKMSALVPALALASRLAKELEQEEEYVTWTVTSRGEQPNFSFIDHTHLKELIIINRVYTDAQGHTVFDVTRNI